MIGRPYRFTHIALLYTKALLHPTISRDCGKHALVIHPRRVNYHAAIWRETWRFIKSTSAHNAKVARFEIQGRNAVLTIDPGDHGQYPAVR